MDMRDSTPHKTLHPKGEPQLAIRNSHPVETFGGKIHVEWDSEAEVTPMGQLSFFVDFLKTTELFDPWVDECPLSYSSPNAPLKRDVLGTLFLSLMAGHKRYAHITSIRADGVNPKLLGMTKVVSEDSARRSFQNLSPEACKKWQQAHLTRCWEPLLYEPWILDIDTTIKPLYGKQEGAEIGYNPNKPGRPSHVFHTYMMANTRLILDIEVQPGNQTASSYSRPGLFEFLDNLPREKGPTFIRGDSGFGNEGTMLEAEKRELNYLFKLRQSKKVKDLIEEVFTQADWSHAGQGWEGTESRLKLMGWSQERRVVVLRREIKGGVALAEEKSKKRKEQQEFAFMETAGPVKKYEFAVLVTSLSDEILTIAQHYRDRSDSENVFDELKNQWSWGGFTTKDIHRCQVMARHAALFYNWWSLFVRLAIPHRHAEAITSRPLLLYAIGRQTHHAGQTKLLLTSMHGKSSQIQKIVLRLNRFLCFIRESAEQLTWSDRWRLILNRIFIYFLKGKKILPPNLIESSS